MYIIIGIAWFVLDQLTKQWVQASFLLGESLPVIPNVFHLTYILNKGAAFGILANQRLFFLGYSRCLTRCVMVFSPIYFKRRCFYKLGTALLVSGALGNGWDRYHLGAVVDFFDFRIWPIFNVADIGICVGVVLLAIHVWRTPHEGGK